MTQSEEILTQLKTAGERITKVRRCVIEYLCKIGTPLTVAELLTQLAKCELKVNKTTVYRELEYLLSHKIIREIDLLEGMKRYELLDATGHHHHVVCTKCKEIQCIDMHQDLDKLEHNIFEKHKFKVTHHTLEFFGICGKCNRTSLNVVR